MKAPTTVPAFLIAFLGTATPALTADPGAYRRPELLVEPAQLAKPDAAKQYVVLDARTQEKYTRGHIPKARWVDHDGWARAFGHGGDAGGWSKRIGGLGIGPKTKVVLYDDSSSGKAARVWWILRYWAVDDVRLLNGGWQAWQAGKHPTETGEAVVTPANFVARPRPERLATKERLLGSLKGGKLQIVDARSEKEFSGVRKLSNKRAGAIPGARQLEWIDLIDRETHRFKSPSDLRKLFAQADIDLNRPAVTYCQTGGRASVMAFALELMGAEGVSNYYPSWAEWGNVDDTPVVPGKPRK